MRIFIVGIVWILHACGGGSSQPPPGEDAAPVERATPPPAEVIAGSHRLRGARYSLDAHVGRAVEQTRVTARDGTTLDSTSSTPASSRQP